LEKYFGPIQMKHNEGDDDNDHRKVHGKHLFEQDQYENSIFKLQQLVLEKAEQSGNIEFNARLILIEEI